MIALLAVYDKKVVQCQYKLSGIHLLVLKVTNEGHKSQVIHHLCSGLLGIGLSNV